MKTINAPYSAQRFMCIGVSKEFDSSDTIPADINGYVRIKNVSDIIGHIRLKDKYSSSDDSGMAFSPGETECVYINEGDQLEVVDGEFNIMY